MRFLPPAGGIAAGTAASPVGVGVLADGVLSTGCECRGVGMPSRCLRGLRRASETSGGDDTCGTSVGDVAMRTRSRASPGEHREAGGRSACGSSARVRYATARHHGTPPRMRRYPARCLPAGGRNLMDNTPTPPRAVGSRGTGAEAPSSRAQASACARRVRHCGEKSARLTASVRGTSRRVRRATARHHDPLPMKPRYPRRCLRRAEAVERESSATFSKGGPSARCLARRWGSRPPRS